MQEWITISLQKQKMREKIYYNPEYGKMVVFVEDKELGKKML